MPPFIEDRISAHAACLKHKLRLFCHQWPSKIPWRKPRKPSWRLPQTSSIQLLVLPYLYDKSKSTYRHSTSTNTLAFQPSPWDLGETGGRFTSHNFLRFLPVFSCHIFQGSNPKIKSVPSSKGQTLIEKQRFSSACQTVFSNQIHF